MPEPRRPQPRRNEIFQAQDGVLSRKVWPPPSGQTRFPGTYFVPIDDPMNMTRAKNMPPDQLANKTCS
jgi:hypothetical protein